MIGTHGRQAPQTTVRERYEVQWQPYDDGQWWTDLSELSSLEEAREYQRTEDKPYRIVRVTETCVYDIVECEE